MAYEAGTVTAASVSQWGGFSTPTGDDLVQLQAVIDAVDEHIERYYVTSDGYEATVTLAVLMQASRLWKRRQSIDGVAAIGDFGPIRVSRLDPDVSELLTVVWGFG